MSAYLHIYERCLDDAAFLWHLRSLAVDQPNHTQQELAHLDARIEAKLNVLAKAPNEAWELCRQALEEPDSGEVFAASVLAFRSLEVTKIQHAVEVGLASFPGFRGLVSALAWLPGRLCHSWIKRFLTSKDLQHKLLGLAACSVRREDPREYLTQIIQRPDCMSHPALFARALRLVGELKRSDLMPVLRTAMRSEDEVAAFWASWSAVLLGDSSSVTNLQPMCMSSGALQNKAMAVAFRALPVAEGRQWIRLLARDPAAVRQVIRASAWLGDPEAMPWLLAQMRQPALSRFAGEAFTTITGIDLSANGLALDQLPNLDGQLPNDDPADPRVDMDEDEHLPFPDPSKVAAVWEKYRNRFTSGQRYFLGRAPAPEHLSAVLASGNQRQRRAAAMELAIFNPATPLINCAARSASEQHAGA